MQARWPSLPILATLGLFYAVGRWNNYFNCLLYINDSAKWNVQVLLRQIVVQAAGIGDSEMIRGENAVVFLLRGPDGRLRPYPAT